MNTLDYYYKGYITTSSSNWTNWSNSSTSSERWNINPSLTLTPKKKKEPDKDIIEELEKIAEEQEADRVNNLPKFNPKELDI